LLWTVQTVTIGWKGGVVKSVGDREQFDVGWD